MTDDEVRLKALVDTMRKLGDPLSGTSLYHQAATVIESLSRDLAAAKERIVELESKLQKPRLRPGHMPSCPAALDGELECICP